MAITWKKIWWFIWEDDSVWSWLANVVIAFILIKFIVYPSLGFLLGTSHPIVAVVSNSMEQPGSFDQWWASSALCSYGPCTQEQFYLEYGISKDEFKTFPYKNGFNTGDIMILYGTSPENIRLGDIIVFQSRRTDPIIHRVIQIKSGIQGSEENTDIFFHTKGDHNSRSIIDYSLDETNINSRSTVGYADYGKTSKAVLRIPFLGYIKIWFVKLIDLLRNLLV